MPSILESLESFLGKTVLYPLRNRDAKLLTKSPAFNTHPTTPKLQVSSPECGPDLSQLSPQHTPFGENRFPALAWAVVPPQSDAIPTIAEWLVVVEDPDAPLPSPVVHGLYYGIPAEKMELRSEDFVRKHAATGDLMMVML